MIKQDNQVIQDNKFSIENDGSLINSKNSNTNNTNNTSNSNNTESCSLYKGPCLMRVEDFIFPVQVGEELIRSMIPNNVITVLKRIINEYYK